MNIEDFIRTIQALLDTVSKCRTRATAIVPREWLVAHGTHPKSPHCCFRPRSLTTPGVSGPPQAGRRHDYPEQAHLRIFLALTREGIPVRQIKLTHVRAFLDAIRWWPEWTTIKPQIPGACGLESNCQEAQPAGLKPWERFSCC